MAYRALQRLAQRLQAELSNLTRTEHPNLSRLRRSPELAMLALGYKPDVWQLGLLRSTALRVMILAARQVGKSRTTACIAIRDALLKPGATIVIVSPSERQSIELLRRCKEAFEALGRPLGVVSETQTRVEYSNSSRILALPAKGDTCRGLTVDTLICDEAARIPDELFDAVSPMLAVTGGRMLLLSSPCGKRGVFHREWTSARSWERVRVTADRCPRISPAFLESERERMTEEIFLSEYGCVFGEIEGFVFSQSDIDASMSADVEPLVLGVRVDGAEEGQLHRGP